MFSLFVFVIVSSGVFTRNQAWNRCIQRRLTLPYSETTKDEVVQYMKNNQLDTCWMGVKKTYYDKGTFQWLDGHIIGK